MPVRTIVVATTTSPVQLTDLDGDQMPGCSLSVKNLATGTLYVGGPDVTTTNGWPLVQGESLALDLAAMDAVWGVLATGTGTAVVLRTGV